MAYPVIRSLLSSFVVISYYNHMLPLLRISSIFFKYTMLIPGLGSLFMLSPLSL